jgi:hypothetical protein
MGLPTPPKIIQAQSANIAFGLMAAMDLVSVFAEPMQAWIFSHYEIERVDIVEKLPDARVYLIKRKNQPLTSAARQLVNCIRTQAARAGLMSFDEAAGSVDPARF